MFQAGGAGDPPAIRLPDFPAAQNADTADFVSVVPNASFMGKAITAFQTEERREKLLRSHGIYRFTDHTVVDRSDREWERVQFQKFAAEHEAAIIKALAAAAAQIAADLPSAAARR